jgi:hypothetical protein
MEKEEKEKTVVELAKERFRIASEAYSDMRQKAEADTKFAMADSDNMWAWPEDARSQRESSKRVCLTINLVAQHCNQIINGIRQNRPAVKVSPVDSEGDKDTAEIFAGMIRTIHTDSNADDAHDTAAEHAVYGGEGYWRILTEYETPDSFNQVIKIKPILRPDLVLIDPHCKELDKSDAEWGFVFEDITRDEAKEQYPNIDVDSWESEPDGWITEGMIRRAEYFYKVCEQDKLLLLADGRTGFESELKKSGEEYQVVKERKTERERWKWAKLLGKNEKPVEETDWLGDYLPIVSVVGKEIYVGTELIRKGIVRDLKDQGRMVNYAYSETVQTLALQNRVPYMAATEAIEGHEDEWNSANLENLSYLPYNAFDQNGNQIPQPARQPPPIMPAAQIQLLQLSTDQMRAASGQQNANFGIKSEAQSGVGIQRLKQQGEVATFHFPDNLSRALRYEGRILVNLIPKYYDTARIVRITGLDGKEDKAYLQPGTGVGYEERPTDSGEIAKIFDPLVGRYDVKVDTGPSYMTMRQEAAANLNDLAGRNPSLMQIAGDLIMRAQDFPMAEELAERLEKVLPPGLKEDENQGHPQIPPQLMQEVQQMQQQLQQAQQVIQHLEQEKQSKMPDLQLKKYQVDLQAQGEKYKFDQEMQVKMYDAETKRLQALAPPQMQPQTPEGDLR